MILDFALFLTCAGLFCCLLRALLGPNMPDRVIALDLAANIALCIVVIVAAIKQESMYLDVAIAMALIIFLSTVAFAQLTQWRDYRKGKAND